LAVTVGYDFPFGGIQGGGRVEIEFGHRGNKASEAKFSDGKFSAAGDFEVQSLLVNSFAVLGNDTLMTPYFGIGIGGARVKADDLVVASQLMIDEECLVFAYQGGGGIDLRITNSMRLDLGYRYFGTTRPEFREMDGRKVKLEYGAHTGIVGLIYMCYEIVGRTMQSEPGVLFFAPLRLGES
jgi:opacity protein-like surface antigen